MATEADTPEAISVTKEGEGRYLTSGQFDITISQCSPVQVNKSEGESDQHLETVKCFAEGENTQVGCSAQVESKNSSFGISEGGSFLASLSDSKVDKQDTCVSENSQGDESNQAEMEILDKEDQLLRGKEFGVVEETGSKEKEVEEIDKKAEQHIESHGIANDLDEHVQVISDQQDSINENPQCVEKEAKSSHEDVKGRQLADEIADSSSEQVSLLLEECSFQEDEAAVRTLDLTNNSFKKDIKPETSIDENRDNTSSTNTIFQEEFEEETGIKGLKNKAPESFDAVYEEKGPEATVFNNDKSTDDDSSSTIVAGPDIPNDEATLEAKEYAEDKLQKTSMTDDHEEKAGLEVGKKANEAPGIPDTPLITQTEETHLLEVGNPDIFEVYPEIGSEDIIKESPKEPEYQNEFLEETPEASDTASETVKDDESSERHFGSPCMKHEENTHRKGEALDVGKAKAGEEEDSQGFAAVGPIQETEQSNMNSAEHEGETETNLVEQIESAHYDIERPLNLNSEENDTETLRENTKTITTDEAERQVINLEQSFKKEGKEDTAIPSYEITKDEIPEEKVLKEPEISGGGESTTWELNKNIEIPENIVNTSTVKCEEGEQGEGKNTAPTKATEEDHRDEDPFTVEVAEEDHDYNSAISVTETSAKVTSNDEEDAPQALQKYEPGGELQNVLDVMPEEIKTETSRESAEVITCRKEERTIQNSQESSDKERKEHIESTNNTEENDTAVVEACTMAADLSTIIEEKNLEEQEIQKLSSSLVVEETTKEISEEEEIYGVILKEERKEAHAKCKEPAEGANLTQDLKSETTEERTETDKDIYAPISEGETHAEESKKTFVPKNSFLSDVPEMEIEKHFQVNDLPTVSNFDSVSGIVSQVTGLEEAETENQEQEKKNDIAPEEKVLPTIFTSEKIDVQEEENFNSKEKLENQIRTTADKPETCLKEAEAENKEHVQNIDPEEKGGETILTDKTALDIEDIAVQAGENFNSKDNLEEQIPTAADEGETFWKEAEAENKEEIKHTDIASEEKGLEIILTDETALNIEDINVQAEENLNSKDNLEKQIPTSADEETILTDETALDIEDIYVQAEENFSSKENLEEQIPTTADEHESCLKEAQAENKEQVKNTDIIPEEKGLVTILTDGTSLDIEDIYVQAEETFNANEKLEEQIPKAVNEGETFLKEVEAQNEEQAKNIDIAHEEKGLPSILTDETALDIEDNDVQAEENFNLKENLGKEIQTTADERETFLKEAEAENQEQVKTTDIVPEEKGLATILTDETSLDVEDIDVQAEQNFKSKENLDEQIPAAANEGETCLKEAESENKEQTKYINISPEEKGLATILTDETASEIEDSDVQAEENFNSKENLEKQFPTAANEVETCLKEAKAENKEQVKDTDIVHEEKGLATVLTDDTSLDVEDIDVQAEQNFNSKENLEEQIPTAADEDKTCFKDAETENKEQTKTTDIAPEEKGLATISAVEMALDIEDIDVKAEENFNSKEILEKQIPTAANEGETCLKEAESENKEQTKNINIAPEEKGLATTLTDETASEIEDSDVQAEENFNSKENLEKQFPTAADEVETCLKEAKAENKEQVKDTDIVHKEKGLATVLTDDTCLDVEDIDVQAEQNFNSKENLEKQFPTAADEVETCLKEAKAENKEQVEDADIVHEEKGLATVLTDDTSLDVEDIDVQAEQNFNSKENLEEQIPTAADEDKTCFKDAETENKEQTKTTDIAPEEKGLATILAVETALDIEDIDVKAEESFNSKEILEKQIITAADEGETGLKDAEAENKEQVKNDIAPEEKVLATILTDETSLDVEDIDVQAEQNFNSKENLEEHIPAAADEDGTCLKEAKAENKEQVKDTDIVHEEKGLATVLTDDTSMDVEDIDVQAEQNFNSKENLEEQIPTVADEDKTCFKDAETENKKQTKTTDIAPEEKGLATISTDETSLDIEDIDVKAGEIFNSKEILEQQITTAADEGETGLKDAEAENHEKVKNDIAPKERVLATILTDETASEIEDSDVQAEESFNLKENLEKQIPTAADEGETGLKESESEHNEQVENDITPEEKVLSTILTDETALDIEDIYVVAEGNFDSTDSLENQIPTEAGKTTEQSFQVQSLEEADPKLGVEDESHESEDHPEKNNMIVEEPQWLQVFDEPKITGRDLNKEEILEGNVTFSPESIEEDAGNNSQEIEKEIKNVKEEGSSVESMKEGNGDDLSPEYIPEDESEKFKEDKMDAVEWKEEILEESRTAVIGESTVSETNKIAEEILNTLPVKYEEGQQGEGNIPASAKASEEEDPIEDTFPVKLAEVEDDDISTVAVIETSAKVIGEEGSPRAVQKYEPGEGLQKLLDVMPEETKAESSRENAQVITCTKEERAIQNIKESKEEDTNAINDTKQKDTGSEEFIMVLERNSREQETGVHALQEIHPQEFNDKETTEDNSTEYQACIEAADFSPKIVQGNLEEQANRELSSSLVGDNTIKESSEEEENYVSNLKEEKKEAHEECKEPIEVTNMIEEETNSETFEDKRKPNEDLCTPISEEETHAEESNSFQSEVSEKDGSTVINSDSVSGIVRHQTVLKEAEAENKEQVENTDTALDEKGLATILTDGTTLDVEGVDEQSDENSNSKEFSESQIPTVAVVDEGEEKVGLGNINLDDAPVNFQVRSLEEAEPTLRVEDENNNMIAEEVKPQLLDQVFDEPKNIEGDFNKGQIIEANAAIFSPELKEEGSSIENIKELNANDLQLESIPEDEILQELHAAGVGEGTACETMKYEEGPLGEGNSPTSAKASNEEDKDEETFSVKVDEDDDSNNGAVTVTETSEKVTSNEEGDSSQSLEKYELGEEVQVKTSDLAYENKVYNLEVKASFAERTAEETSLRKEGHKEVSDLALEKLDVDATEEEIREGSEIVPKSDSQSIDVVSKDDIIACQALHEGISKEQLQIPSSTLLPEEEELKSNQHEHETTTQDKNIEEEHTHEREVPADENTGDLFSAGSVEEAHLQKEEPRELKASELSLEKLDAGESEEEIKESFEKVSKSDCLSIDAVSEDEIIADQTLLEGITDMQLQIPSHSLLPKEEELKTYEHEHGITTQDKSIEEEHAKKIEMPADENGGYFFTARSVEETILHKEEPRELKCLKLILKALNVVSKDEIIAYQIVHEGISKDQLQIPSSILLHEEKEIKASEDEHGTTSEEICPQKEEPKDAKVSEMALKTLDADETAEETEETCETANKFASQSINVVTEVVDDQTLCKVILKETPSTALLTGETKHATITTTEEENMSNVQIQDDENGNATSTSEEKSLPKEEPSELKVSDVELYSSKELQKESSNEVHEEERSSLIGVPEVEPHEDEEGERYDDSLLGNQKTTELKGTTMEASNLDIETSENASDCAPEEGFSRSQDATINGEHLKNEANETNETIKNEVSNEQKHLEVAISDSRAEERWCETTIEANETRKNEVSNEEIEAEKLEAKDLRPISVSGENISHREQENELIAEKYEGEKSESFSTARNENQDNEESPKETTQVAKHLTEDKELQTEENLCDTTVEANEKIKTGLSNDEIKEDKELPKDSEADSVREESHQEKKAIAEEYQVEKTSESSVIRKNENRGELPEEKDTTASKEVQTEEEEEEHENAEEVKIYEETGENEHTNAEPGYDSPVIVEASRDADAKISHKKSHNILSGIKHSISKVKKAITGKSSHSKTQSEK
ncbi:hypothetical protein Prudu_010432 [Prunus dulcis]|uniref:Titin-like n=1 Tax=Prunus dulcis TaxID=3755 RepID=A0A4Y1R9B8_PRUDU|nr:hypothetical protein Prudu_010432 [Prunus dulcis]